MGVSTHLLALAVVLFLADGLFLPPSKNHFGPKDATQLRQTAKINQTEQLVELKSPDTPANEDLERQYKKATDHQVAVDEQKYPIIHGFHVRLEKVFGKHTDHWWSDWKLWVGLAFWCSVWAKWIKYGDDHVFYQRSLFIFGINIVILHALQYASTIRMGMLGVCSLLCAQSCFQSFIWFKSAKANNANEDADEEFLCDTLYLDLTLPVEQIVVLFVSQCIVWWFYMTSILGNFDFGHVNYVFWFIAFLAMQCTMIFNRGDDSVLGNSFPVYDVYQLMLCVDKTSLKLKDSDKEAFQLSKANIIMRCIMGYFCNGILREIMAYTIPLMLMGFAEPMDFVVYCVGVNFICTLDDTSDRVFTLQGTSASARKAAGEE